MLFSDNVGFSLTKGLVFRDKMGRRLSLEVAVGKVSNRIWSYILDLELLIVRVAGWIPFYFIRYFVYLAAGVKIDQTAHLHMGTQFFYPAGVKIGKGTIIGQNAFLDGRAPITIGDHVDIASDVMIYTSEHDINSEDFSATHEPVEIGDYVFIGPRVIILPGVKIGRGAVLGAGAVVTKDVEPFKIVGGVPAREIGERVNKDPHYRLGRVRLFQ